MAGPDDEHRALLSLLRIPVGARVELRDRGIQLTREGRNVRLLEDPGCNDDRLRLDARFAGADDEPAVLLGQGRDGGPEPYGKLEMRRVGLEVVRHLVLRGICGTAGRQRQSW